MASPDMVPIKGEPMDDEPQLHHSNWNGEHISLLSDDEEGEYDLPPVVTSIEQPNTNASALVRKSVDLRQIALQKQRELAQKYRAKAPGSDAALTQQNPVGENRPVENSRTDPAQRFEKLRKEYERKKAAGTASITEQIEFMRIEAAEKERLQKAKQDADFDRAPSPDSDSLFVREDSVHSMAWADMHSSDDEEGNAPKPKKKRGRKAQVTEPGSDSSDVEEAPPKRRKSAKKPRKVAGTDYTNDQLEDVLNQSRQSSCQTGKSRATPKKKAPKKSKAKKTGPSLTNLGSIFGSNVFDDAEAVAERPDQPEFRGFEKNKGTRKEGLKQLVASVPQMDPEAARSDAKALENAVKKFTGGGNSVRPAVDGNWSVVGMKSTLKHYQVLGVGFMRERENQPKQPRGGILADDMGLGKTVQMLANIINGRPQHNSRRKATLIVATPALISQWAGEIGKHCYSKRENRQHGLRRVIEYRSGSRVKANDTEDILGDADIVLTTWHEVLKSYPKAVVPIELVSAKEKDTWWKKTFEKERGVLHRIKWLRVCLDEAQAIKNHKSSTSMACRALDSRHNWAISGTPIMNRLAEFYAYFKFLQEPSTGSYRIFKQNFLSPDDPDGTERLNVFLRKVMLRRTHGDTMFDSRLLDLPTPSQKVLFLEFNDVERQIYEIVKRRFIERINTISRREGLEKQYKHIWSMLLRLRQLTGHILLVQGTILDLLEREDFERLNKITEHEDEMNDEGRSLLLHLRNVLKNNHGVKSIDSTGAVLTESHAVATGVVNLDDTAENTGGKHGNSFRFRKYLNNLKESGNWEAITQRTLCCGCRMLPEEPYVTSCFHIYCRQCLNDLSHNAARFGHDGAKCSECGEVYASSEPCQDIETFQFRASTAEGNPKAAKKKGSETDWIGLAGEILPSAKTIAIKAQVLEWLQEDPECKTILYMQFLPMARILSKLCITEGWGFCQYTGAMSQESRIKAIEEFATDHSKKILIASLKSGGQGLNLTMASRVICIDPWWNQAVESQSFGRVYRIGQSKETRMTRLVVKNTVDAAMMTMKTRKQLDIDQVMEQKKEYLSVEDLLKLFGRVGEDGEGRPFIFADEEEGDEPEHLRLADFDEDDEMAFMGNEE